MATTWKIAVDQYRLSHPLLSLKLICKLFDKHRQSYYEADKQEKKMDDLGEKIVEKVKDIRKDLPGIGTLKLYFLLKDWLNSEKIKIGRDKFHELLRSHGLLIKLVKGVRTTHSDHAYRKYADLRKEMLVEKPDKLWVSDITYLPVGSDFAYLSLVTDAYSRKILGWSVEEDLKSIGPVKALKQALQQRKNRQDELDLIHHSDRGVQYCSGNYIDILKANKIAVSMTQGGDPRDNGIAERVHRTLKTEFRYGQRKGNISFEEVKAIISRNIERYNNIRPHASIDYLTPAQAYGLEGPLKKRWKKVDWKKRKKRKKKTIILEDLYHY